MVKKLALCVRFLVAWVMISVLPGYNCTQLCDGSLSLPSLDWGNLKRPWQSCEVGIKFE